MVNSKPDLEFGSVLSRPIQKYNVTQRKFYNDVSLIGRISVKTTVFIHNLKNISLYTINDTNIELKLESVVLALVTLYNT